MSYPVSLGGVTFDVPSLPWRLTHEIQPGLLGWAEKLRLDGVGARMTADGLAELAAYVFRAVATSAQGRTMTQEQFADLPITTLEMAAAVQPILRACGLKFEPAAEGSVDPKAETGTG